jgi:hypothetical protein
MAKKKGRRTDNAMAKKKGRRTDKKCDVHESENLKRKK